MIYKPNFKLIIGDKEETENLIEFNIILSALFHTQHCEIKVSNINEIKIKDEIEFYLGYEELYKVFTGYITEVSEKEIFYIEAKDEYLKFTEEKITKAFNKITPREIIEFLTRGYQRKITDKSFIQKHHFIVWNETKDEAIRSVINTWNIKNFVWYFDVDKNFHFHEFKTLRDYPQEINEDLIYLYIPKKEHSELILTKPTFDIYPLDKIKVLDDFFIVETVIHNYKNKTLKTILKLSKLSNLS